MIAFLNALVYVVFHPSEVLYVTVVRRYADAQKRFIGELYVGEGRTAKMIGASCDNLPLEVKPKTPGVVRWGPSFLDPMEPNTVLVGAMEPKDNASIHAYFALRRFCVKRVDVLNRFVEHILESDYV